MINKELTEKMQWLYSKGFDPDLWYSPDEFDEDDPRIIIYKEQLNFIRPRANDFNMPCRKSFPYFTESRLWSLLTKRSIDVVNKIHEVLCNANTKSDLHSDLLDLVIWAVKEGYLKPKIDITESPNNRLSMGD